MEGGMSEEDITTLKARRVSSSEAKLLSIECINCSVCLDQFCTHQTIRELPECKHAFHAQCIDPWLRKKASCPVCRRDVDSTSKRWKVGWILTYVLFRIRFNSLRVFFSDNRVPLNCSSGPHPFFTLVDIFTGMALLVSDSIWGLFSCLLCIFSSV